MMSPYLANKLLDHVYGGVPYTAPSTIYFALYVGNDEVDEDGYQRQPVGTFAGASGGGNASAIDVVFEVPEGVSWGTITGYAYFDAVTGGNVLDSGTLSQSATAGDGDIITFDAGALTITVVTA